MKQPLGRTRIVVELDDVASEFLRRYLKGQGFQPANDVRDPRDVASAAVCFLLGDPDAAAWGDSEECLDEATARREATEGKPTVRFCPPVDVPIDQEAAVLLARYARQTRSDARDIASGMLYSMLAIALFDSSYTLDVCIDSARERRLERAKRIKAAGKPPKKRGAR